MKPIITSAKIDGDIAEFTVKLSLEPFLLLLEKHIKQCVICGKPFEAKYVNRIYCCDNCRQIACRRRRKQNG
jgi:hypothetical protein